MNFSKKAWCSCTYCSVIYHIRCEILILKSHAEPALAFLFQSFALLRTVTIVEAKVAAQRLQGSLIIMYLILSHGSSLDHTWHEQ